MLQPHTWELSADLENPDPPRRESGISMQVSTTAPALAWAGLPHHGHWLALPFQLGTHPSRPVSEQQRTAVTGKGGRRRSHTT